MTMSQGIILTDTDTGAQEVIENRHCYYGDCALSPDGRRILLCGTQGTPDSAFPADMPDEKKDAIKAYEPLHAPLVLFDIEKRKVVREFWYPVFFKKRKRHKDKMKDVPRYKPSLCAWSPDGSRFAAVFKSDELMMWDAASLKLILRKKVFDEDGTMKLTWIDNDTIATVESKGKDLVKVSVADGAVSKVSLTESKIRDYLMSDDRRFIVCDLYDEFLKIYDLREDRSLCDVAIPARGTAYRWDGDGVYAGTDNGTLHRFTIAGAESLLARMDEETEREDGLQ